MSYVTTSFVIAVVRAVPGPVGIQRNCILERKQ